MCSFNVGKSPEKSTCNQRINLHEAFPQAFFFSFFYDNLTAHQQSKHARASTEWLNLPQFLFSYKHSTISKEKKGLLTETNKTVIAPGNIYIYYRFLQNLLWTYSQAPYTGQASKMWELSFVRRRTSWNSSFLFSNPGLGRQKRGVHVSDCTLQEISNIRRKCTGTDNVGNILNVFVGPFVENLW